MNCYNNDDKITIEQNYNITISIQGILNTIKDVTS